MSGGPPRRSRPTLLTVTIPACLLLLGSVDTPLRAAGLTSPEPLAKAYELILDARFDDAAQQLKQACGPAPPTACLVLEAVSQYWQLLLDPDTTSHDAAALVKINAAIASAEGWVAREPKRGEAWFYLGGAYGTRVLLKGMLRDDLLAAARDGRRIHNALQQATTLDPTLQDAYFGLGLYHYYAATAPTVARMLGWLLMLPGGDRAGGLREMAQTQNRGMLLRGEADYQLHLIFLWYEHQTMTALKLAESLRARYPHNPVFALRVALVQSDYLRSTLASLQTYRALLDLAREGHVASPGITEVNARLGMAEQMTLLCDNTGAMEQLRSVIALKPTVPYSSFARAYYQLGVVNDRIGRHDDAVIAYQRAIAATPADDRLSIRTKARDAAKRTTIARACR